MSSKERVIETALKEFMLNGYQKTSLSVIASKLEISKPALYYYFPNKESLFLACLDRFFLQLGHRALSYETVEDDSAKLKIKKILQNFSNRAIYTGNDPELSDFNHLYFVFDAMKYVPSVLDFYNKAVESTFASVLSIIGEGIKNGEIRPDLDIEAFMAELGIMLEGLSISNYMNYSLNEGNLYDRIFNNLWEGIRVI